MGSHITGETSIKGDLEQGAGKNIWTAKEQYDEENCIRSTFVFYLSNGGGGGGDQMKEDETGKDNINMHVKDDKIHFSQKSEGKRPF